MREQLHEFLHVVFVLRDAREHRGRVLGVVEGDEDLHVLRFCGAIQWRASASEAGAHGCVVRGDVARDPRVQLLPQRVVEHLRLLVADAREERRGGLRAYVRDRGGSAHARLAQSRGSEREHGENREREDRPLRASSHVV